MELRALCWDKEDGNKGGKLSFGVRTYPAEKNHTFYQSIWLSEIPAGGADLLKIL